MEQLEMFKGIKSKDHVLYEFFDKNTDAIRQGFAGEQLCRAFLNKHGLKYHQLDLIFPYNGDLCSIEVKAIEMYNNPNAHGLSYAQYKRKMELYETNNIIPYLFIFCQTTRNIYWGSLIELRNGNEFFSKTGRMILFPIDNFKKYTLKDYL